MTTQEFSDNFDTLLASYLHTQEFGEQSSEVDVVLDEYEKSIFLTQAQDIIVKSYFDATKNAQGQGIDDSTERQIDFSNLVSYRKITQNDINGEVHQYTTSGETSRLVEKGTVLGDIFTTERVATIEFWLEQPMLVFEGDTVMSFTPESVGKLTLALYTDFSEEQVLETTCVEYIGPKRIGGTNTYVYASNIEKVSEQEGINTYNVTFDITDVRKGYICIEGTDESQPYGLIGIKYKEGKDSTDTFTDSSIVINLTTLNCLFILNERVIDTNNKSYVIVPLNYKEYDRMSSRAYDEPLKRQAWRLFNNDENTVGTSTEIIMRSDSAGFKEYRVRYVRRPKPIILVDLSDTNNSLNIDGYNQVTECELNPIIHNEILQTAVQLALTSRGRGAQPSEERESKRQ